MLLNPFTFHDPRSIAEAAKLYTSLDNVKLQAGGTFLFNNLKLLKRKGSKTPEHIISLRKIEELKQISVDKDIVSIGATVSMGDILDAPALTGNLEILKTAAMNVGTCAIRNMATMGGNLTCRYTWTEMPAVMVALEGALHFTGADGKEESVAAEEFYKNKAKTDKLFTRVSFKKDDKAKLVYRRVKKSPNVDIPLLSLLIKANIEKGQLKNTRVGINNCIDFAQRDQTLEDFLNQSRCEQKTVDEALDHLTADIYDTRSSDYKKHVFRATVKSAIAQLVEQS